jgi:hypothetical protein
MMCDHSGPPPCDPEVAERGEVMAMRKPGSLTAYEIVVRELEAIFDGE